MVLSSMNLPSREELERRIEEGHREIQRSFARMIALLEEEIAESESAQDARLESELASNVSSVVEDVSSLSDASESSTVALQAPLDFIHSSEQIFTTCVSDEDPVVHGIPPSQEGPLTHISVEAMANQAIDASDFTYDRMLKLLPEISLPDPRDVVPVPTPPLAPPWLHSSVSPQMWHLQYSFEFRGSNTTNSTYEASDSCLVLTKFDSTTGGIHNAFKVFDRLPEQVVVVWPSLKAVESPLVAVQVSATLLPSTEEITSTAVVNEDFIDSSLTKISESSKIAISTPGHTTMEDDTINVSRLDVATHFVIVDVSLRYNHPYDPGPLVFGKVAAFDSFIASVTGIIIILILGACETCVHRIRKTIESTTSIQTLIDAYQVFDEMDLSRNWNFSLVGIDNYIEIVVLRTETASHVFGSTMFTGFPTEHSSLNVVFFLYAMTLEYQEGDDLHKVPMIRANSLFVGFIRTGTLDEKEILSYECVFRFGVAVAMQYTYGVFDILRWISGCRFIYCVMLFKKRGIPICLRFVLSQFGLILQYPYTSPRCLIKKWQVCRLEDLIQFSIYINGFDYVVREIVGFTYFNVTFIIEAATAVIDEKLHTNSLISDMQLNSFSLTNGANLLSQGMVSLSHKHKLMNGVVNQSWQTTFRATTFDHYGTMVANSDRSKVIGASGPPFVCQRHKLRLRCLGVVTYKFESLENDQQLKVLNNANYKPLVNSNLITILWKALDSDDSLDAHAFVIMLINCKVVVFIHCKGEFNIASLKEVVARNCWLKDLEITDSAELFGLFRKELMGAKSLVSVDWEQLVVEILDKFVTNLILFNDIKVENKLQSRVFSCISKLAHRGIQSWVLTGYTMEIILTIGFACSLLTQGMLWSIKSTNNVRILIDWFDSFKGSYLVGFPGLDHILLLRQQARHATCVLATKLGLIDHLKIIVAEPIVREIVGNINGISSYLFGYYAESSCVILIVASITSIETTSDYAARTYSLIICLLGLVVSNILYQDQLEVVLSAMGTTIGEFPLMKNVGPYESPFIFTLCVIMASLAVLLAIRKVQFT